MTDFAIPEEVKLEVSNGKTLAEKYLSFLEEGSVESEKDEEVVANVMATARKKRERMEELRHEAQKKLKEEMQGVSGVFIPAVIAWSRTETKARLLLADAKKKRGESAPPLENVEVRVRVDSFDQIPREYLVVDYSAAKLAFAEGVEIPGLSAEVRGK